MRFSITSVALLAGAVAAVPQYSVQPISQISDGQIQAPPATSAAVPEASEVVSSAVVVVPTGSDVEVTSTATLTATVSSVLVSTVVPTATPVVPSGAVVTPIVGGNSTVTATGTGAVTVSVSTSTPEASEASSSGSSGSSTSSPSAPEATQNSAAGNTIAFGGLVLAIGAAVFA